MYKFNSFWLELSPSLTTIERKTYSMLEWLGDIGGLFEGLNGIGYFLVAPLAAFAMKMELLTSTFSFAKKRYDSLKPPTAIPEQSFASSMLCCETKNRRYKKMLRRAEGQVVRQLDLVELLHRQRMIQLAVLVMLPPHSAKVITNLSTLPIYESSDLEESSGGEMVQAVRQQEVADLDEDVNKTF